MFTAGRNVYQFLNQENKSNFKIEKLWLKPIKKVNESTKVM